MNATTCDEMDLLRCLEPDPEARGHLAGCYPCQERAQEAAQVRGWAASQDPEAWAGAPSPEVDVEAALAAVLARRSGGIAPALARLAAVAAALLLVVGLTGPAVLRLRLRGLREAPAPAGLVTSLGAPDRGQGHIVFWTAAR